MSDTAAFESRPPMTARGLAMVIATVGRRGVVAQTVLSLARRRTRPATLILVGAEPADLPELPCGLPFGVQLVLASSKSLPEQRNCGIRSLPAGIEYVTFLDDDVEVHDEYCAQVGRVFDAFPGAVGFSGHMMANGNIGRDGARAILDRAPVPERPIFGFYPRHWPGFYGCAMNIRRRCLDDVQFDEELPLYALGEDAEMGFRLSHHGAVGGSESCLVVHLAVRSGRLSEIGVGYAQIINPLYFSRIGIGYPKMSTYWQKLVKTPLINLGFLVFPGLDRKHSSVDRRGRFRGNLLALADVLTGHISPSRLLRVIAGHEKV